MNFWHFLLAIFAGRFIRFLIEALLTLWFGPALSRSREASSPTASSGFWLAQEYW